MDTVASRLAEVRAVIAGERQPLRSSDPWQRPLLYYPGLPQRPFYDVSEMPWVDALRRSYPAICAELNASLRRREGFEPIFPQYADAGRWAALWFVLYGKRYNANCEAFPATMKALSNIPRPAGWAGLSALEPGAHVRPHCGVTNAKLRLHYALLVEPGSRMRVADLTYTWEPGDIMVFDDSYEHEVWAAGTSPRIVLVTDFYHPALTDQEVAFLQWFESQPTVLFDGQSLRDAYQRRDPASHRSSSAQWVYPKHI